jgi:hypothetical protein
MIPEFQRWIDAERQELEGRGVELKVHGANDLGDEWSINVELLRVPREADIFFWDSGDVELHLFDEASDTLTPLAKRVKDASELADFLRQATEWFP